MWNVRLRNARRATIRFVGVLGALILLATITSSARADYAVWSTGWVWSDTWYDIPTGKIFGAYSKIDMNTGPQGYWMRSDHSLYWWDGSSWQWAVHNDFEAHNSFWYTVDYQGNKNLSYHNTGNICDADDHNIGFSDPDKHSATSQPTASDTDAEWWFRVKANGQLGDKYYYPFNAADQQTTVYLWNGSLCD